MIWIVLIAIALGLMFHPHFRAAIFGDRLPRIVAVTLAALLMFALVLGRLAHAQQAPLPPLNFAPPSVSSSPTTQLRDLLPQQQHVIIEQNGGAPQAPAVEDPYYKSPEWRAIKIERERVFVAHCKPEIIKGAGLEPDRYKYAAPDCP